MLERLGYNVTSRTGSVDALETFKANQDKLAAIEKQLKQISDTRSSYLVKLQEMMQSHLAMVEAIEKDNAQTINGYMPDVSHHSVDSKYGSSIWLVYHLV